MDIQIKRLLFACIISIAFSSVRAESGSPKYGSSEVIPKGCVKDLYVKKTLSRDLENGADFVDSSEKLYYYHLLRCDKFEGNQKNFRLRLVESNEVVDELILPWVNIPNYAVMETSCLDSDGETDPQYDIGAIGILAGNSDFPDSWEVVNIDWAWRLDAQTKKLRSISKKNLKCRARYQGD